MLSRSETLITKRFLFSKKTEGYVSVFSWFSIIGIMLGVAAIIIVMSVMNGFRSNLTERLIGVNSHLNVYSFTDKINGNDINIIKKNLKNKDYKDGRSELINLLIANFLKKSNYNHINYCLNAEKLNKKIN